MFASNHGLAGMVIGAVLPIPIAIPVAFISHFFMDSIPHYGVSKKTRNKHRGYQRVVYIDTIIALSFAVLTAATGRWDMFWIGWVAYSPDGYWVYLHFKQKRSFNLKLTNSFAKFHSAIQSEHSWGWIVELPVAIILFSSFLYFFIR